MACPAVTAAAAADCWASGRAWRGDWRGGGVAAAAALGTAGGTPPQRQRVAKPEPKPEPERKREACSDGDIVPTIESKDWPSIEQKQRPVPELISLRYPEPDEKYVVFGTDGKIRCIAGPWKLWVYYQLMKLPWPYDKRPVALNNREVNDYRLTKWHP